MLDLIEAGAGGKGPKANGSIAARLMEADFDPMVLRSNDVLRNRDWIEVDQEVTQVTQDRLVGNADLIQAGLTMNLTDALGVTVVEFEKQSDMTPAEVNMSGVTEGEQDRLAWGLDKLAVPVIHKDFRLNVRALASARRNGHPLDTSHAGTATRKVTETAEDLLFVGSDIQEDDAKIYGYTSHPQRMTMPFGTNGAWDAAAKTGDDMVKDLNKAFGKLRNKGFRGPYWVYLPTEYETPIDEDYKALGSLTRRQRLMQLSGLTNMKAADRMPSGHIVVLQATRDVIKLVVGFQPMTVEWDEQGGMKRMFKVMSIMVPMIKADYNSRCGIVDIYTGAPDSA